MNDEEILHELQKKHSSLENVKRFIKKVDGKEVKTHTFLATYNCTTPPNELKITFNVIKTRPYYPSPFRCYNCLAFGHPTEKCKKDKVCAKCSELMHEGPCTGELKCAVCKKAHHTLDGRCPSKIKENQIIKMKVNNNITYREAKSIVDKESSQNYANVLKKNLTKQVNEENNDDQRKNTQKETNKSLEEIIHKYEETVKQLSQKMEKLEDEVKRLRKELEKAQKAKQEEKDERVRAQKEFDVANARAHKLETQLKLYTGNKIPSPPRKKKGYEKNDASGK